MDKHFDIFLFGDRGPTWIEAVETFEDAKLHIEKLLAKEHSGDYAVIDLSNGHRVFISASTPHCHA